MNKTHLAEKRYSDKQKSENCKTYNNQLQQTKETTKLQKKKQYELNKKQYESKKEIKQNRMMILIQAGFLKEHHPTKYMLTD